MKKFKKILFILISISLFKTTTLAMKENKNKINIINEQNNDENKKEKEIKNVYDYIKCDFMKSRKNFDVRNTENTKEMDKNLNLLNSNEILISQTKKEKEKKLKTDTSNNNDSKININLDENKKEENPNKINIINEIKDDPKKNSTKEELEIKIRKIIDNFKEFKKMTDLENVIKGLENRKNSPKNILNAFLFFQYQYGPFFKIYFDDENLLTLEEDVIRTLYPLIIKDDICVIAETLNNFKNQEEFKNINENLKNDINIALRECSKFRCYLSSMCSKFDELFQNISYIIAAIPSEENDKKLKDLNNKNNEDNKKSKEKKYKRKNFDDLFKKEIEILNKKQPFIDNLQKRINYFIGLYEKFTKSNFNYKITENTRKNLIYLDKVLDIELVAKNYFNSLKNALKEKDDFKYTLEESKTLTKANNFFSKIEEINEKMKSMLQTLNTLVLNAINLNKPQESPIIPLKDKIIDSIDEFFYLFEKNKTKNFIEKNKMLENLEFYKKMFSEMLKYEGEKLNESEKFTDELEKYKKEINNFKKEFYDPYIIAKNKIINLDLEKKYKEELDKVEKIFKDGTRLEEFFSTYIETIDKLIGKSKIKLLHYNYLNVPIERWNSLEPMFEFNKENIKELNSYLEENKEKIKELNSYLEENKNAYDYIYKLAIDIKNQITIIELCKLNLQTFNELHIENSKETDDEGNNDSLIEKFKNIKRKHKEYSEFFKKSKEYLESFLKIMPIKIN